MKRLLSLLLATALCLGLGVTALADGAVELPSAEELVSTIVQDYGGTVEYAERQELSPDNGGNGWAVTIQVGGADDLYNAMDLLRTCLDTWLWLADFSLVSGQAPESYEDQWEYVYSYPDGGVGTVYSPNGSAACNAAFTEEMLGGTRFVVRVFLGEGVTMAEGAPEDTQGQEDWDGILPDPGAFFQCGWSSSGDISGQYGNGHNVYCRLGLDGEEAVNEYLALLNDSRFHLEQYDYSGEQEFSWEGTKYCLYRFAYVGSVPGVEEVIYIDDDYPGNVFLIAHYHYDRGYISLGLDYGDGLTLGDPGDRASVFPQDLSGNIVVTPKGPDPNDDDDDGRRKCTYCDGHGTRDCRTCDGKGYIEIYVSVPNFSGSTLGPMSGWEHHDCPNINCHDGQVDCEYCDNGWID